MTSRNIGAHLVRNPFRKQAGRQRRKSAVILRSGQCRRSEGQGRYPGRLDWRRQGRTRAR